MIPSIALANDAYRVVLGEDGAVWLSTADAAPRRFEPRFTVLATEQDPRLELRWGDWGDPTQTHLYNVLSWLVGASREAQPKSAPQKHVEDGFDPASDRVGRQDRTQDVFAAAPAVTLWAVKAQCVGGRVEWTFPEHADFSLSAILEVPPGHAEPRLEFRFTPKAAKWFSVGYTGAPEVDPSAMDEMWQPMIWQEKRLPNRAFLTESGRCTIPATLVGQGGVVCGLVADPGELPFMPMPTVANSRFGVAVRNAAGRAQSALFAPILGGVGSKRAPGQPLTFALRLVVRRGRITDAYEALARGLYGFRDRRRNNGLGSLNRTLERTIEYAMSEWARFNGDLRGCAYDTDVPGAVKNVSALHPLGVALVTDDESLWTRRARPILEYLLSRERFLFTVNPEVKGQGASAKLNGPGATVSELAALYAMSGRRSPCLLRHAEALYGQTRTLNLDASVRGDIWQNALALYRATGEGGWLDKAVAGADAYLRERLATPQRDFKDPASRGMFFWTSYAPNWMELCELFEVTGARRFLEAAREGARRFAQFVWMCPVVPEGDVLVNEGGCAPLYRKGEKFPPIRLPEERVPAWRVSEIGLTPESSGTCKGHRGVLLATHGPWLLRLAQWTGDQFLHDIGRSAIVGRYAGFPGYHMNTARATVYEKPDFAQRPTAQLNSTTSLHYNHIWPHVAMLLDYLVADAEYRSRGAIAFPSHFAEGYAYLQQRVYGDRPGAFYGDRDVWLWMPKGLLMCDSDEVNYLAARSGDTLYLALLNQSAEAVSATCRLDPSLAPSAADGPCETRAWQENQLVKTVRLHPSEFPVDIAPGGITALAIQGVALAPKFQTHREGPSEPWRTDSVQLGFGGAHAMILNFGPGLLSAYVYLQADGAQFRQVTLRYSTGGEWREMTDAAFPFEFTVPLAASDREFRFSLTGVRPDGRTVTSDSAVLRKDR